MPNNEFNGEEMVLEAGEECAAERGTCFDIVLMAEPIMLNMASGAHLSFLYCFICFPFIDY